MNSPPVLLSLLVALMLLGFSPGAVRADHDPEDPPESERLPTGAECAGVGPEATLASTGDAGQEIGLRTLVLVDREGSARAAAVMRRVVEEYARIGLTLDLTYQPITLSGTESWQLLQDARAHLARTHTAGFEIVHVLTGVNLTTPDGDDGVAGHAICIGGIRHAKYHLALSISETNYRESREGYGRKLAKEGPALAAAHEIAHVLGAQHAHGNCAENANAALAANEATVCTVMDQTLFFSQLRFGQVERAVVRGFALQYGSP